MSRPKVYLSGPMTGLIYENADDWRQYAAMVLEKYGMEAVSPLRGKEMLKGKQFKGTAIPELVNGSTKAITFRDHMDTATADVVLVNLADSDAAGSVSIGTVAEIAWAYAHRVPVVVATGKSTIAKTMMQHPIMEGCAPWIVEKLDDAVEIIRQLFNKPSRERRGERMTDRKPGSPPDTGVQEAIERAYGVLEGMAERERMAERRHPIYEDRDPEGYRKAKEARIKRAEEQNSDSIELMSDFAARVNEAGPGAASLPSDPEARKNMPMARGLLWYFPNALAAVAELSMIGNQQHNPGQEMHWARSKSSDHADTIIRHLVDVGKFDRDGVRHSAKVAWRALALLQEELEAAYGLPLPRGAKLD